MERLAGRVAVVTGAASGIGKAMTETFAREGMHVVVADVEQPALEMAAKVDDRCQPAGRRPWCARVPADSAGPGRGPHRQQDVDRRDPARAAYALRGDQVRRGGPVAVAFLDEQPLGTSVGVSVLCPAWVRTSIARSERNWPARLGPLPENPAAFEFLRQAFTEAIDAGMAPPAVAAQVLDAVKQRRFWILTHDQWMPAIAQHCAALAEGRDPVFPPVTP